MTPAIPEDTRGIIDPARMAEVATLRRHPPGEALDRIVDWFWSVEWALPPGQTFVQQVLNHPGANLSIGTTDDTGATATRPQGRVYGPATSVSSRRLVGDGWTVAAKTTVGGLGALITGSVAETTDRALDLSVALVGLEASDLVRAVAAQASVEQQVGMLREVLEATVTERDPARVERARVVAAAARVAEEDREVRRAEELADAVGLGVRTLQRLFVEYAGLTPAWVIRRWRIIEAAEAIKGGGTIPLAALAAELGYADQAHLSRDFRSHLGVTPTEYLARQVSR